MEAIWVAAEMRAGPPTRPRCWPSTPPHTPTPTARTPRDAGTTYAKRPDDVYAELEAHFSPEEIAALTFAVVAING
jgi:hypothetical protein